MKFIKQRAIRYYVASRRFVFHNMLHADDPPHRIALGLAIGMFYAFTPFIGVQMALVLGTAWLLHANKVVGVPLVWISNPATFVPIFYPCYVIGRTLLGHPAVSPEWWKQLTTPPEGFAEVTRFYWGRVLEIFAPLMLGCMVVGIPLAIFSYLISRIVIERYRARTPKRKPRRRRPATTATP